ncbi:MAG: hypothetical protein SF029_02575 [bacterium]|nr:hypothetical protein [bacterium]
MSINQSCLYIPHDNGIQHFVFTTPSHQAVDDWFSYLDVLYEMFPEGSNVHFLLDLRQAGVLPMTYVMQQGRRWLEAHPTRHRARFVILHSTDFPLHLAQTFFRLVGLDEGKMVRFYPCERQNEASQWLLTV